MHDLGGSADAGPRERFLALDSLRGICAVLVATFHFQVAGRIHQSAFIQHSYMFVDFFFVLSGFVIAASYGSKLADGFPVQRFMALRLGRIYPLHAFMLLLFLLAAALGTRLAPGLAVRAPFQGETSLAELLYGLLFVQIFVGTWETWWNSPSWSISAEMWAYLVAAGLFRFSGRYRLPAAALLSAISFAAYVVLLDIDQGGHHWAALPRCLFSFGLGVCAFDMLGVLRRVPARAALVGSTAGEAAAVLLAITAVVLNFSLAGPLVFAAVVIVFAFQGGALSRMLVTWPMLLLGTLSYSIYMVHSFVEARFSNVVTVAGRLLKRPDFATGATPFAADMLTVAAVASVVAAAWWTYHAIERPGQRWSRGWVLGTRPTRRSEVTEERAPTF